MTKRLTDDEIASVLRVEPGWVVAGETVTALALEVQQQRQRRCNRCLHGRPYRDTHVRCDMVDAIYHADWFCAGFTPK